MNQDNVLNCRRISLKLAVVKFVVFQLVALLSSVLFALAQENNAFKEIQVGPDVCSSIFSFYNTCPESPDGQTIVYVRCIKEPGGRASFEPGELWVCDRNLKNHRKVTEIKGVQAHNGVEAQWVDNNRVAIFDNGFVRLIDVRTGKDLLSQGIPADGLGHNPHNNKVLYHIYTEDGRGKQGIYELDCNTGITRLLIDVETCSKAALPSFLTHADIDSLSNWRALHSQYSPDGSKIAFRLDVGSSDRSKLLGICNIDGSGFKVLTKSLHFLWYDDQSIVGHMQVDSNGEKPKSMAKRLTLTRWNLHGELIEENMTPSGNHLALSPDRRYFVSETFYKTNPVIMKRYEHGRLEEALVIAQFNPYKVTWERRFHANPAFSRDGKRIYYSRPLNERYNGIFYCEIKEN